MIELILLVLRALQFLFALIVLGLTGHLANYDYSPSQVNFMVFNAVWTMLVLIYLAIIPRFVQRFAHVHVMLALDALTMLFWFAGFIALAVLYHDIVGVANFEYFAGCGALGDYCGVTEAAVVFGALEWLLFLVTTVISAMDSFRSRGKHDTQPTVAPAA